MRREASWSVSTPVAEGVMMRIVRLLRVVGFCAPLCASAADDAAAPFPAALRELGKVNGVALACGYTEVAARVKALVLERAPKTRSLGQVFEEATREAFAQQVAADSRCPAREFLAAQVSRRALSLPILGAHRPSDTSAATSGIVPRYLLQGMDGRAIRDSDFHGRLQLLAFGYTSCPDVCPTTLVHMADVLRHLPDDAAHLQALFISVDPERDTLAVLRDYCSAFDPRILCATGSIDLLRRAADSMQVRFEKVVDSAQPSAAYAVDHTAAMVLLGPHGEWVTRFPYGTESAIIAERIALELRAWRGSRR